MYFFRYLQLYLYFVKLSGTGNNYLKVKDEQQKSNSCCEPNDTTTNKPTMSKFEYGEKSFVNGTSYEQTPSPSESVCSSTSGKESSISSNSCSKDTSTYTPVPSDTCTYLHHASRFRRSHSDPDRSYLTTNSQCAYSRIVSSPYAHHFFKQEFHDRGYDMTAFTRNHAYPQAPSAPPSQMMSIKQEPRDQGYENARFDRWTCSPILC
ncbi:hypothetical protein KUTeg_015168 [Tegillarca granosa]|uniref:Uncharacterized protein n=1 Tax=Tegillarca granosa TaxID=220873 RepID=A0ABQ9EPC4_TEGGR|nr:hypothetical protein KUTeg_015168 [Tegillarca granosa]